MDDPPCGTTSKTHMRRGRLPKTETTPLSCVTHQGDSWNSTPLDDIKVNPIHCIGETQHWRYPKPGRKVERPRGHPKGGQGGGPYFFGGFFIFLFPISLFSLFSQTIFTILTSFPLGGGGREVEVDMVTSLTTWVEEVENQRLFVFKTQTSPRATLKGFPGWVERSPRGWDTLVFLRSPTLLWTGGRQQVR